LLQLDGAAHEVSVVTPSRLAVDGFSFGLERLGRQAKNASFSREKRRPYERNSRLEVLTQNGRISKPKPLFAAIARETNVKGEDVRFKKTKQGNSASANRKKE